MNEKTPTKKKISFKTNVVLTAGSIVSTIASRADGTINRRLLNIADLYTSPSSIPVNGVRTVDYTFDVSLQLWFRLFIPDHATYDQLLPVIIYFHGGGFVQYSPSTTPYDTMCRHIAKSCSALVISANDITEKVANFPANADLRRCFLAGDSSGGNLVHHVAVRCGGVEFKKVSIRGLIMIQPGFGGEARVASETRFGNKGRYPIDFFWKAFLPNGSNRDHPAVNVFGSDSSSDVDVISNIRYPSTLVIVGGQDSMQDRQRRYVDGLKRSGKKVELVEYSGVDHGFYGATDESTKFHMLIAKVNEFVQNHIQLVLEPVKSRVFYLSKL